MTRTTPARLMILHFAQIAFTDDRTFISSLVSRAYAVRLYLLNR
jgi:hypothetical protein